MRSLLACILLALAPGAGHAEGAETPVEASDIPPPPGAKSGPPTRQALRPEAEEDRAPKAASPASKREGRTQSARTIGLLLPLSGPSAALGKSLLDAATLALYDMQRNKPLDRPVPLLRLAPKDTQGTPEGAKAAFRALIEEEHPIAILGPLFSTELETLLPLRNDADLPMFAFTNNARLAGRGTYQLGFMAEEQARLLAAYAKAQKVKRVAGVASADSYGRQLLDRLTHELKARAIEYGPTVLLSPSAAQAEIDDEALAPLIQSLKDTRTVRQFLFIGSQGAQLDRLVLKLAKARVLQPNLVLAGSGAWDDLQQLSSPAISGAVFVAPPREGFLKFAANYQSTYGARPPRVAGLAYDAVALIANLVYGGAADALSDQSLQNPQGFRAPTGGLLRFNPDGTTERRLAVFIANGMGGARVVQAAPNSF